MYVTFPLPLLHICVCTVYVYARRYSTEKRVSQFTEGYPIATAPVVVKKGEA